METISVNTNPSYNIYIERGILKKCGEIISHTIKTRRIVIITDDIVNSLYSHVVKESLKNSGFIISSFIFKNGEAYKNTDTLNKIYKFLCENNVTRTDCIIALGGGVVGDIAGFAAATYLRGVDYIQIPTTLLAQIDSSIGGKTAIDLQCGKNLVGAFKQPICVLCDPNTLSSLTPEIYSDGMAEAIKYGMIKNLKLFDIIASHNIKNVNEVIDKIIYECITIKMEIVEKDEFDLGERMILNFGHTLGHAIESYYNYKKYTHGSAVAIGMCMIAEKTSDKFVYEKLISCIKEYNLPICCEVSVSDIIDLCLHDKKCNGDLINYIICEEIGKSSIKKASINEFKKLMGA